MLFLFFFFVIFNNFFIIPVVIEKIKVKLALTIPTGTPIILVSETMILLQLLHLKQLKFYLYNQKL